MHIRKLTHLSNVKWVCDECLTNIAFWTIAIENGEDIHLCVYCLEQLSKISRLAIESLRR